MTSSPTQKSRTLMTLDYVYKDKGGSETMLSMANDAERLQTIADHYGITRERVSQILRVLLDMPYSHYLANKNVRRSGVTKNETK